MCFSLRKLQAAYEKLQRKKQWLTMRSKEAPCASDTQHRAVKIPFSLQTSAEVEGIKQNLRAFAHRRGKTQWGWWPELTVCLMGSLHTCDRLSRLRSTLRMAVRRFLMMLVDARRGFILITGRALPWTRLLRGESERSTTKHAAVV